MAHYDIFRDQLAVKYPAWGHALWEPGPGRLYPAVEVGDVGYIREGRFHRLFNVLLPADHPSHQNLGVPPFYEPLKISRVSEHIDSLTLGSQDFCSRGVTKASAQIEVFATAPPDPGQLSFSCARKQGAVLCLPVQAQREDTIARGIFRDYIIKHIDDWFDFTEWLGLGIDQMEDIILVTGRDRTKTCTNVAFSETDIQTEASVRFGVDISERLGIQWRFAREHVLGAVLNPGRSGKDLPEDQCIFIRGWRVIRTLMILRRLRGAAGPSDLPGNDHESGAQAMFVPTGPRLP
ncbi:hypothetical protein F5148DRAFT_183104 [Russula earlei]|uniref:Uncharacterized protein n=1 Tax=Russula earlei TaxID=71964 RepID=A0ACC0ULI5_9AGAM|nr:hypothetical protein F5148DRAFT_183104 [Russula earlei]